MTGCTNANDANSALAVNPTMSGAAKTSTSAFVTSWSLGDGTGQAPAGLVLDRAGYRANVELRILGPLEVIDEGGTVALGGPQHRTLVARLLLARGRSVPLDDIIGSLWDGEPPRTARQQVHKLVSAVRRRLPGVVETVEGGGYRIVVDDHWFDADKFAALTDRGDIPSLVAAPDLWRGLDSRVRPPRDQPDGRRRASMRCSTTRSS